MGGIVTDTNRSYAILGTGALGGFYGAKLHHAGLDVHFLLHSDFDYVSEHGLDVRSNSYGDLSIAEPNIYRRPQDLPRCDVVLVALKTTNNDVLVKILPAAVGPDATVLMMQNGLGVESAASAVVPHNIILGGLAFLCSNKLGPGRIHHLDYGAVRIGEHRSDGQPAGITPRVEAVGADFRLAGLRADLEADLVSARWLKLVWNMTFNGLCVVRGCTTDVLMNDPDQRAYCNAIMREVAAIAAGCGHGIAEKFLDSMMRTTDDMVAYKPSMLLDYQRKNPLELDAIYAAPLAAARKAGVECPKIEALYRQLKELDTENRA